MITFIKGTFLFLHLLIIFLIFLIFSFFYFIFNFISSILLKIMNFFNNEISNTNEKIKEL